MLQNPNLPMNVRQTTQMQLQHLQGQVHQAQIVMAMAATMSTASATGLMGINNVQGPPMVGIPGGAFQDDNYGYNPQLNMAPNTGFKREYRTSWTNPFSNQQPAGTESAYQRLPVNNRRRNIHRERPSDFYEVAGGQNNIASYWE